MNRGSGRHAYLIIAHNNFRQLQTLLDLLDDERNDIYLHIDLKSRNVPVFTTKQAGLIMTERLNVMWGGYSQIACELALMEVSGREHYDYYHLLSGIDLPLKTQDQIHAFFRENGGKEYIDFDEQACESRSFRIRTRYYHWLQNYAGSSPKTWNRVLRVANWGLVYVQKFLKVNRKELLPEHKGANWFSITDGLVQYVLENRHLAEKQFAHTFCADEVFLQTMAMGSPRREHIVNNFLRAIDWQRGDPYVYRAEDVPELLASDKLWGRKFNENVDQSAIDRIVEALGNKAVTE